MWGHTGVRKIPPTRFQQPLEVLPDTGSEDLCGGAVPVLLNNTMKPNQQQLLHFRDPELVPELGTPMSS